MHVVADVVHTVAVVAVALGAVAEFHGGIHLVGDAAHGAFVDISLGLPRLLLGLLEIDGLLAGFVLDPAEQAGKIARKEQEIVQNGQNGDQCHQEVPADQVLEDGPGKECSIQPGQPLDFHRDEEKDQELCVGVQGGKGKEHGQVHIGHGGVAGQKAQQHIQYHTHDIEQGELGGAPLPLQRGADHPVQIGGQGEPDQVAVQGNEHKGDQAPDLPVQDVGQGEVEQGRKAVLAEHVQQIDQHGTHDDDVHQVGNAEPGMLIAEAVQPGFNGTQR